MLNRVHQRHRLGRVLAQHEVLQDALVVQLVRGNLVAQLRQYALVTRVRVQQHAVAGEKHIHRQQREPLVAVVERMGLHDLAVQCRGLFKQFFAVPVQVAQRTVQRVLPVRATNLKRRRELPRRPFRKHQRVFLREVLDLFHRFPLSVTLLAFKYSTNKLKSQAERPTLWSFCF